MKFVKTKDGSFTLYCSSVGECCHSLSGALEEAYKKYVEPARLFKGTLVLDVCFGLGYNSYFALKEGANVIGIEKSKEVLDMVSKVDLGGEYEIIKKVAKGSENSRLKLYVGDARDVVKKLGFGFDAVLFDPFSPRKCPEMWSVEFFKDIYKLLKIGGRLTTYSCASIVRKNLVKVGFSVIDGPVVGRKSPGTVAVKI